MSKPTIEELRIQLGSACEGVPIDSSLRVLSETIVGILLTMAPNEAEASEALDEIVVHMRKRLQFFAGQRWRGEPKPGHG